MVTAEIFILRSDMKFHVLVMVWILCLGYTAKSRVPNPCERTLYESERVKKRRVCRVEGRLPAYIRINKCRSTCHVRNIPKRVPKRIGRQHGPLLVQYPQTPRFADDSRFCLAFEKLLFHPQEDVIYTVQMADYTCSFLFWNASSDASKLEFVNNYYVIRFGILLYGGDTFSVTSNYKRLNESIKFNIRKDRQKFSADIADRMEPCLKALKLEGTATYPHEATSPVDHCQQQTFSLSYPAQCTSLTFEGGWKRGQTVTSKNWAIHMVERKSEDDCIFNSGSRFYRVQSEISDRHISIFPRQLRRGLNRICNLILFTTIFETDGRNKKYGPYQFKICGYVLVNSTPCIVLKPKEGSTKVTTLPFGESVTLDAVDTIGNAKNQGEYLFQWSCRNVQNNTPCALNSGNEGILVFEAPPSLNGYTVQLTLTFSHLLGTPQASSATESRLYKIVNPHDLYVTIQCLSNCKTRTVSVTPVVLIADCDSKCANLEELTFRWNITDVSGSKKISDEGVKKLVAGRTTDQQVFSITGAGNVLLEHQFSVCVLVVKGQGQGDACYTLDYSGAPLPQPGDGCIITPYSAELPGFLEYSYNGLCNWHGGNQVLRYRVFTYDVGVPEQDRQFELVAFSDISRLPNLELPFGNPKFDYQLGVVFHISNADGLTYVYDVKDAFQKINVVFKVRKPVDFAFLNKVETITDVLQDQEKFNQIGSRQGIINVAGLVANVIDNGTESHASGLGSGKRSQLRESLLTSLASVASSDMDTVLQLTPIVNKLTTEVSDQVEEHVVDVLEPLTQGLRTLSTDYQTANRLSRNQYAVLERVTTHSHTRQIKANFQPVTTETKDQLLNRSSKYTDMFLNIGTALATSTLSSNKTQAVVMPASAIAVKWQRITNDSVLSVTKPRTNESGFGSAVSVEASALNLTAGSQVNIIMAINRDNLFLLANGSKDVNMPMINVELQHRGTNTPIPATSLSTPVDIFLDKSLPPGATKRFVWELINITTQMVREIGLRTDFDPLPDGSVFHVLKNWTVKTIPASDRTAYLLRFNQSDSSFSFQFSVDFVALDGSRREIFQKMDYPRKDLRTYKGVSQDPEVLFLPAVNSSEQNGSYEVNFTIWSTDPRAGNYTAEKAPYLLVLNASVSCRSWNTLEASWESFGCEITDFSNFELIHCQCYHLSIFSGGILVPSNPINILDVRLFAEFFNNPAIVSVVVFIWLVYFILIYWAREQDMLDTFRSRVAVLEDNKLSDNWAYLVCCVTGWWVNSGTTAKVFLYLKGTHGMSRVHRLKDDEQDLFVKGAENWFILTTPASLGKIKSVVIWHDSSGESPAWFLKEVFVQDINQGSNWHCLYNDWLSVEHGDGDLCVEVPALTPEVVHNKQLYQMVLKTSLSFRRSHIWLSILLKPPYSSFTRVQRLSCALCLLLTTMLSSLMFYGVPSDNPNDQISTGPLRLNLKSLVIGVECSLVVFPINILLVQLFVRTSKLPPVRKYPCYTFNDRELVALEAASKPQESSAMEETSSASRSEFTTDATSLTESGTFPEDHYHHHHHHHHHHHPHHHHHHHHPHHGHLVHHEEESSSEEESSTSYSRSSSSSEHGDRKKSKPGPMSSLSRGDKPAEKSAKASSGSLSGVPKLKAPASLFKDSGSQELTSAATMLNSKSMSSASTAEKTVPESGSDPQQDQNVSACAEDTGHYITGAHTGHTFPPNSNAQKPQELASSQSLHSPSKSPEELSAMDNLCFSSSLERWASDTNNSALESDAKSTKRQSRPEVKKYPSRRIGRQFSLITETACFQSAVTYLRNNISRMLKHPTQVNQDLQHQKPHPSNGRDGPSKAKVGRGSANCTSYFDKLKDNMNKQTQQEDMSLLSAFYAGGGDWEKHLIEDDITDHTTENDSDESLSEDDNRRPTYFDKLKAKNTVQRQFSLSDMPEDKQKPLQQSSSPSSASKKSTPKTYSSTEPGHTQTVQHIQPLPAKPTNSEESSARAEKSHSPPGFRTLKQKLKQAASKLKPKTTTTTKHQKPTRDNDDDPEKMIPFQTIRLQHDFHYQQAMKEGPRAVRAFRRQAAQCFAESLLNTNRNAHSPDDVDEGSEAEDATDARESDTLEEHKEEEKEVQFGEGVEKGPGCCKLCMGACLHAWVSTFVCLCLCQCPKGSKLPWWTVYLSWLLTVLVALFSSWLVMLYGLRLGYQRSVDWLSSFFTGWCQNVLVLQPMKVILASFLYIIVLKQHVNVREEADITIHDEHSEPVYKAVLKELEERKRLLDGMWTTTDYAYPMPRSKARDIRLRLEQDARARVILRESLIWAVYLLTVTLVALGHTRVEDAHATNTILRTMLEESTVGGVSFEDVGSTDDVWDYALSTFLPSLYADSNKTTANNVSLVLGTIRIRQVRQTTDRDLCKLTVPNRLAERLKTKRCYPHFHFFYAETRNFDNSWKKPLDNDEDVLEDLSADTGDYRVSQAWRFRSSSQLQETLLWGQRAVFPGGGYAVDLPGTLEEAEAILDSLQGLKWLDSHTRALVMRVNLYTPSKDLISVVTVLCEWTQEGPVFISLDLHTTTLHWYATDEGTYTSLAEIVWMMMMTISIYDEMHGLIQVGVADYLSNPWSYLELLNFYLSLAAIAVQMARVILTDDFSDKIVKADFDTFVSFAVPRMLDEVLIALKSFIFMLVVLKVFKVVRFNRFFRILLEAFYIARFSIFNQTLIAFVLFMAFGITYQILFGYTLEEYRSFGSTMIALLSIGLGEGDFEGIQETQRILGPIMFFLFVIFFAILTISFFVSFVLESFNVSRVFVQLNAEEQHVLTYLLRLWRLLIGHTPKIKTVRRQRRTHPFKQASFIPQTVPPV